MCLNSQSGHPAGGCVCVSVIQPGNVATPWGLCLRFGHPAWKRGHPLGGPPAWKRGHPSGGCVFEFVTYRQHAIRIACRKHTECRSHLLRREGQTQAPRCSARVAPCMVPPPNLCLGLVWQLLVEGGRAWLHRQASPPSQCPSLEEILQALPPLPECPPQLEVGVSLQ